MTEQEFLIYLGLKQLLYQYRKLDHGTYYVAGLDFNHEKPDVIVLEWCSSSEDADERRDLMAKHPQFSNLTTGHLG